MELNIYERRIQQTTIELLVTGCSDHLGDFNALVKSIPDPHIVDVWTTVDTMMTDVRQDLEREERDVLHDMIIQLARIRVEIRFDIARRLGAHDTEPF